ncbi:hypothetical protein QO058_24000 [Bosea vestrisii]|uniref:hypothetical protein n=1 Tax=Bosea vestrisii TaxID=151416 RepID=UPI0024DFD41E|nr:hypothetical protein [Bosea vestrisii]WID95784.1 hypothetical protein QO058_24000 [Bosea vestrisii]
MAWASIDGMSAADKASRDLDRALLAIFLEAAGALIDQLVEAGISDPADIARRLNRRGFPCFGRPRWGASTVSMVRRRWTLRHSVDEALSRQESACSPSDSALGSAPAST